MNGGKRDLTDAVERLDDVTTDHGQDIAELKAQRDADRERVRELAGQLETALRSLNRSSQKYREETQLARGLRRGGYVTIGALLFLAGITLKYEPQLAVRLVTWLANLLSTKS